MSSYQYSARVKVFLTSGQQNAKNKKKSALLALFVLILVLATACLSLNDDAVEGPITDETVNELPTNSRQKTYDERPTIGEEPDDQANDEAIATGEEVSGDLTESSAENDEKPADDPEATRDLATTNQGVDELPIFDTHVHYNQDAWSFFSPYEIIDKMEGANVPWALVSSSPDDGTRTLYQEDPDRIVPFLRPYHDEVTSGNWFEQNEVLPYFGERLEMEIYQGIGEFHLHFDGNANSQIVRQTARLAIDRDLYLHIHSNAQAVHTIFGYAPEVKILWAHAGMNEPPEVVSEMMDEYDNLWADISIREYQIAPKGELDPAWRELFLTHSDRITIGSDTWTPSRWGVYQSIISFDRHWLNQLPRDVAENIAYRNAVHLFGTNSHQHPEQ